MRAGCRRTAPAALAAIDATDRAWAAWLASGRIPDGPWRSLLERSALVLRGLTYAPTGLPVAAATTSLPETPGGERNWDYRYTWLRDGTYTLAALQDLGFPAEARRFIGFLAAQHAQGVPLQLMFRVGGELELPESTLDHLSGYEGARPVRIGNGAAHQAQHDMWGALLDLVWRDVAGGGTLDDATWALCVPAGGGGHRGVAAAGSRHLGGPRRAAPLHQLQALRLGGAGPRRPAGPRPGRRGARRRLGGGGGGHPRGPGGATAWTPVGVFTQSYGVAALDASVLLMLLLGLPAAGRPARCARRCWRSRTS